MITLLLVVVVVVVIIIMTMIISLTLITIIPKVSTMKMAVGCRQLADYCLCGYVPLQAGSNICVYIYIYV